MSPGRPKPNLWRILSDTYRVISGHPGHFSILSLLFILPTSIGPAIYAVHLQPNLKFLNIFSTAEYEYQIPTVGESITYSVLYSLSTLFFSTCAGASITYSVHHGFNGGPVDVISTVKSTMVSFLPILATNILVQILTGLIISVFMALLVWMRIDMAHHQNGYIVVLFIAVAVLLGVVLIYLQIVWSLTNAVVVVESNWGYSALKRSSYLVTGARGVMFLMSLFFGVLAGVLAIGYLKLAAYGNEWMRNSWFVVNTIVVSGISTLVMLYSLAAVTVFFICCKAYHEPESGIDDKRSKYDV